MSGVEPVDYVLGEMSDAERSEAEALMATDPAFRAEVERLMPIAGSLSRLPAEAWEDAEPPPAPSSVPERARRLPAVSLRPRWAGAVVAAFALVAIGAGVGVLIGGSDEPFVEGTEASLELIDGAADGSGSVTADDARVSFRLEDLPASEPGEFYEAWLLEGPRDVVSLGGFRVGEDGEAELDVPLPEDPSSYRFFDISIEADDGDPAHSGRSVLRAST